MRVKIKRDTASSQAQLDRKHQTPLDVSARNKTELFGRVTTHTGLQQRSDQNPAGGQPIRGYYQPSAP